MGTTRGDALAWVQRMKDHGGKRRTISKLSNADVRHLATNLDVEAASRRLPTDKKLVWEQEKWCADTRKSMIDCIWRMCEVKKKDGSTSARARKERPNKQKCITQGSPGSSVTEGGGAEPNELSAELNVDPDFDENADDPDLENINEPGPDGTPVSDEERLRLLEIARGLHDTLFEPIPGSVDHDGMRNVRIKAERDTFNSRSKAARGTETTAYERFCFWMATQPLDDPDRADTIDLGRLFEYMQWVALLKVKGKGTLLSANTLKGQWTMANRFKLCQEAARGKSNDRGMTLARVQKYVSGLYRGAAQAGHDNPSYGVLANTGLDEGSHHAWDHNKATYKFLRRKVMYEKAMVVL
ncbi:hypothetical protein MVLG_06737 [Microbotryum lychnidis-dioicae p1A1 Lamole]|uniref:Uncharacterized protein n=1 Tax=Microbotryum lychnidis-dioicae (strain p1A1 Lamole / MvSl-1064) TaxID=683840 RepID=U5HI71_USTV1|nr:hypothetical protein MVLG_06737 [Microbotryum lychnidis-dioicae p1A1 Lamole]|eukprot:KDE02722.1 hypothetical protein MVLG_06737 [Microbotryum lychnidis-dioicae p1A1 Lamole]